LHIADHQVGLLGHDVEQALGTVVKLQRLMAELFGHSADQAARGGVVFQNDDFGHGIVRQ
jgi:hypothetical protein